MPRASEGEKKAARVLYETGAAVSGIAEDLGRNTSTINGWKKAEGWTRNDAKPLAEASFDDPDGQAYTPVSSPIEVTPSDVAGYVTTALPPQSDADLHARIAELEEEVDKYKPTVDISLFLSDPVRYIEENHPEGEAYWQNRAEAEFANENISRRRGGLPEISLRESPETLEHLMQKIKDGVRAERPLDPPDAASRTVKLAIMRGDYLTIEQLPYEAQVNNIAGSLADGIIRYTRKGFKIPDPFLCPRKGCYRESGKDESGRWTFDTYCCEKHRKEVEGDQESPMGVDAMPVVLSGVG